MLSKIIGYLFFFSVVIFPTFIHHVQVPKSVDVALLSEVKNRFKGSFVTDRQIREFIQRMNAKGNYQRLIYQLNGLNGINTLSFDIVETPVIRNIIFKDLPISNALLMNGLRNKKGSQFNYRYLESDIRYINQVLDIEGYFLSSVRSYEVLDDGDIVIEIESPRLQGIEFIGLKETKPFVLFREIVSKKNTHVDRYFLDVDYQSLLSMPYFSSISSPSINYISSDNVTISYRVKERKINRLDIGIEELEKDQGVGIFSKFKLYHMFIYSDFLLFQAQLGYLNEWNIRTYQMHYQQPWIFNLYQFVLDVKAFTMFRSELYQGDSTTYDTIRIGGSIFLTKPIKKLFLTAGAGFRSERVYPQITDAFSTYNLNSLSVFIDWNTVKAPLNPKNGHRSKLIMDKGGQIFGVTLGGVDFTRISLMHSQYVPIQNSTTIAYRLFGGVYYKQTNASTFETEKFSLGGSNSLRGYKELSFYGNYRWSFNIEPRYQFNDGLMGVLFLDGGFISDAIQSAPFYYGYGVGVRFLNALVPLRLDLAYGNDLILHFNVSQAF